MMTESMSLSFRVEDSVAGAGVGWGVGVREAWVPLHPRKGSRVPDKAECLLFCKSGTFLESAWFFWKSTLSLLPQLKPLCIPESLARNNSASECRRISLLPRSQRSRGRS